MKHCFLCEKMNHDSTCRNIDINVYSLTIFIVSYINVIYFHSPCAVHSVYRRWVWSPGGLPWQVSPASGARGIPPSSRRPTPDQGRILQREDQTSTAGKEVSEQCLTPSDADWMLTVDVVLDKNFQQAKRNVQVANVIALESVLASVSSSFCMDKISTLATTLRYFKGVFHVTRPKLV